MQFSRQIESFCFYSTGITLKAFFIHAVPFGRITLMEQNGFLIRADFGQLSHPDASETGTSLLREAAFQLDEYFLGRRFSFDLPLQPSGSRFQLSCWNVLCSIPYGETITYGEQALLLGKPKASRAVGMANHYNPLPIFIPCHRVIGKNGSLTGYGGGLQIKEYLLTLEKTFR